MQRTKSGKPRSRPSRMPLLSRARYARPPARFTSTKILPWSNATARPTSKPPAPWFHFWIPSKKARRPSQRRVNRCMQNLMRRPSAALSEIDSHGAISKLLGLPQQQRYAKVRRSVEGGSDLLVAALTKSDPFLVEGALSHGERPAILDLWRKTRFPEDYARLTRLELDAEVVSNTAKIIAAYQKSMSNQSIATAAGGIPPMLPNQRGAPGPRSVDRGFHSPLLAERAAATTRMIAAAGR